MFKHLRDGKAKTSGKIARMSGKSGSAKDADAGIAKFGVAKKRALPFAVEGKAAKARLDRPGRKMRADGGTVKRAEAKALDTAAAIAKPVGGLATLAGALAPRGTGKALRALTSGTGAGTYGAGRVAEDLAKSKREEADRAVDGKEDRKRGGAVKKR